LKRACAVAEEEIDLGSEGGLNDVTVGQALKIAVVDSPDSTVKSSRRSLPGSTGFNAP
jgi:hypothetical protein